MLCLLVACGAGIIMVCMAATALLRIISMRRSLNDPTCLVITLSTCAGLPKRDAASCNAGHGLHGHPA